MARWFRRKSTGVLVCEAPGGLYLTGNTAELETIVSELSGLSERPTRVIKAAANGVSLLTTAGTVVAEHGAFVKLTPRSMGLLSEFGPSKSGAGSIWGVVRSQGGIAKHLDFTSVSIGPSEMLSIQTMAVSIAIQAAIKDVKDAVERVERKVDAVLGLIRATRVGDVLGNKRALSAILDRVENDGVISSTDWSSISSIGPDSERMIEGLRAHLRMILGGVEIARRPGERVKTAKGLFDSKGLLRESLALLILAEYNFGAWQRLRLAHVASAEPQHLESTRRDVESALQRQNEEDQLLVKRLWAISDRLTLPAELDGLVPWQRAALGDARTELDDLNAWFADQRLLDLEPLSDVAYPSVRQSLVHVRRNAESLGGRILAVFSPPVDVIHTDGVQGAGPPPAIASVDQADTDDTV